MHPRIVAFIVVLYVSSPTMNSAVAQEAVRFDLPPTVVATTQSAPNLVTLTLRLSSMIQSPSVPRIDQWMVTCRPRGENMAVVDYFPGTETASDVSTPIQVKRSQENSQSLGIQLDGSYPHIAGATAGADVATKDSESVQFERTAPVHAVTAAGTIDRGRGVYFKLRWTATQVLEGEKQFLVTMRVPDGWRGSLFDVSVRAERTEKKFGGLDRETVTLGAADFVIAAYREGDSQAQVQASELVRAEDDLRKIAATTHVRQPIRSLPGMLRHVIAKFDADSNVAGTQWVSRLISGRADPHLDKAIVKLPMPLRLAALDYADCRDDFNHLSQSDSGSHLDQQDQVVVTKPML